MKKNFINIAFLFFLLTGLPGVAFAQSAGEKEKKKEPAIKLEVKQAQGEISYITKRSISLVTSRDTEKGEETEILLPYGKGLVIEHKKNLAEIQTGDIVKVKYTEENIDYGDKQEIKVEAKVITFMNPAGQDSPYKKARESLQQQETEQGSELQEGTLPLKGVKSDE